MIWIKSGNWKQWSKAEKRFQQWNEPVKNAFEASIRMIARWPGITQDVQNIVGKCMNCQMNRPSLRQTVSTWPKADVWERLHKDWGYVKDQGNILVIVDAGSDWIEVFPAKNRTSETVKVYLIQIFENIGIPKILVSDNGLEFVSSDLEQWCESMEIQKNGITRLPSKSKWTSWKSSSDSVAGTSSVDSQSQCILWSFPAKGNDDTSQHFKDAGQNSSWTYIVTQISNCANPISSRQMRRRRRFLIPSSSGRA